MGSDTWQGEGTTEQDEHDKVGEEGGEPDDLARGVETLGDDEVDDDPGDHQAASELPLHPSQAVLQALVLLENSVPAMSHAAILGEQACFVRQNVHVQPLSIERSSRLKYIHFLI